MKTKTALLLCCLVTILTMAYAFYAYSGLPERIPTHWDASGHINGYGPKWYVFISAGLPLVAILLLVILPWLSPKNFQIESFRSTFNYIIFIVSAMFGYLGAVLTYASGNPHWDPSKLLFSGIMLFIGLLGNFMGKVQRNFYIGIRTPWTLASDKVWVATHRLGARLMTAAGVLGALAILVGLPVWPVFVTFMVVILYPVLYSLLLYKKLEKTQSV
jgi:uncharacterized membrane protein